MFGIKAAALHGQLFQFFQAACVLGPAVAAQHLFSQATRVHGQVAAARRHHRHSQVHYGMVTWLEDLDEINLALSATRRVIDLWRVGRVAENTSGTHALWRLQDLYAKQC
jgi:hypothetical protein